MAYIAATLLFILAIIFGKHKQFLLSAIIIVLAFVSFLLGEVFGSGILFLQFNLSCEQIVCWLFATAFFCFAVFLLKNKEVAYSFTAFMISVAACFCGLSGVQGLLKTHVLWTVTDSLDNYGKKIDSYSTTMADMQLKILDQQKALKLNEETFKKTIDGVKGDLISQQSRLHSNQLALKSVQDKIESAQKEVSSQQLHVSDQFEQISNLQFQLNTEQTNLATQEETLTNVQTSLDSLFANTVDEDLYATESNRVVILKPPGIARVFLRLKYAPIPNSVQVIAQSKTAQFPLFPTVSQSKNILESQFFSEMDFSGMLFHVRYIKAFNQDYLCHEIGQINSNTISIDGIRLTFIK